MNTHRSDNERMIWEAAGSATVLLEAGLNQGPIKAHEPFVRRSPWLPSGQARTPHDVLRFWFGPDDRCRVPNYRVWFGCPPALDRTIRSIYSSLWIQARRDELNHWKEEPEGCLALMILADQLGRHMFRGSAQAFALDALAFDAAMQCVDFAASSHRWSLDEALIIAWPWLHQESLKQQYRAVFWVDALLNLASPSQRPRLLVHSYAFRRHLKVIREFGRYPHRNPILGRTSTPGENSHTLEAWEMDQGHQSRGGTARYRWAATVFNASLARRFLKDGEFAALARLVATYSAGWMLSWTG